MVRKDEDDRRSVVVVMFFLLSRPYLSSNHRSSASVSMSLTPSL